MTKRNRNPFAVAEKIVKWTANIILWAIIAGIIGVYFIAWPIIMLGRGEPWYNVWAPHLIVVSAPVILVLIVVPSIWITNRWRKAKWEWEQKAEAVEAAKEVEK